MEGERRMKREKSKKVDGREGGEREKEEANWGRKKSGKGLK